MQAKLLAPLIALTAFPAFAQSTEPVRYQLISVSGGFVRLDTVSGVMTFCRDEVDSFRCGAIPADTATTDMKPEAGTTPKDGARLEGNRMSDRSEEDFDRALTMMEKAMKSFMAMSKESSKDCAL